MNVNMGEIDRGGRLAIAALILFLALATNVLGSGILFWVALVVAAVFTFTSFVGNYPVYSIFRFNTCRDC